MRDLDIFLNAPKAVTPDELAAYLDAACGSDEVLRDRVAALFAAEGGVGGFMADAPVEKPR